MKTKWLFNSLSKMIILFTMSVISIFYQAEGQNISIIRGENDIFTNPAANVSCNSTKAVCFDRNCTYCKCEKTCHSFVQSRGTYGECVPNEYLVYVTSYNSSFLVQDTTNKLCLYHYRPSKIRYVIATKCENNAGRRWFWTKNGQLLNLERLECISVGQIANYLILTQCDVQKKRQIWTCRKNYPYFLWQQKSRGYLHYEYPERYKFYYVLSRAERAGILKWKRYGLNRTICSIAVGCEIFHDGSSMLILNTTRNCERKAECLHGGKEIDISDAAECSLLPNEGQYLHKDQWKSLLVENEPFKIETSKTKTSFKWDLLQTPESWKGIIVKVQFQCKVGGDKENETRVYCVLIKYTGLFTGFEKQDGKNDHREENKSRTNVIIVSILVITLFVVIGLVVYLGYRNKNRLVTLCRNIQKPATDVTRNTSPGQKSGISNNPIYNSSDNYKHSAQNDCELYETTDAEHVYSYANSDHEPDEQLQPNLTNDYALPDDHTRIGQQKIAREDEEEKKAAQSGAELNNTNQSSPVYHVLEKKI
ncbi:uncharacterized protein LOC114533485 [Dendronephthya gigantea]|uniref:uncharacterized protein LOC114533485 n=1 Tax=Dendronephthya gigantea TaxID=151771 RepID=UPI00106B434C|nr:uncharacterized protein LOC114533485 [Dendronephthya gigantea]